MSDELNTNTSGEGDDDLKIDELALLKQRATMMGVSFSNNIGIETLKERIAAKQSELDGSAQPQTNALAETPMSSSQGEGLGSPAPVKQLTLRQYLHKKSMKLVRLRIVNLDPKKKDMPGDFFTVANEYLGTVTKYVPFGEVTDNGYHVPYCIYKLLKSKKFLNIRTYTDRKNGNEIKVEQRWANEFALEVLDPLTEHELAQLAVAQAAHGNIG